MTGETVTWHHRTATGELDRYRKPIYVDADTPLNDVLVAPNLGDEVTGSEEDTSSARITLYFPVGVGVDPADEFTVRGNRYKVFGREADWSTGLSDWDPGSVVQLEWKEYVGG